MNNFRIIKSTFRQSFKSMWRNRGMGLASISSISAVLIILGFVLVLIMSINALVVDVQSKFDEVEIFLKEDITEENKKLIEDFAQNEDGIKSIEYISQEKALEILKKDWGEEADLLEGVTTLPDSYKIKIIDIQNTDKIVEKINDIEGIDKIKYHKDIIDKLKVFAKYIRFGGIIVIAVLIAISVFIISNTIKLTVASRRREIGIMKYIGATNSYIKTPFVLEGVLFGIVAAIMSILIVYFGYGYLFDLINGKLSVLYSIMLVPPETILKDISIMFLVIGSGIGALGSIISMKKYLNV
ncbi:permease-like cell division protein FtsX [Tissierella creatinophila]|uniref:Cell division protein FtsX n=1 Tax=Tissierella creatinophila DSM 6911 TaxID=1123403 RepID=A0A1U7M720_TISCR|nr:permease-like cell division protein FtsX [Tissierella creatinophila]OLS03050.1 cell division protein FtsX [Tissierella creatinophila DSM 6911]